MEWLNSTCCWRVERLYRELTHLDPPTPSDPPLPSPPLPSPPLPSPPLPSPPLPSPPLPSIRHNDMLKVKGIFRKMFSEPHTKVRSSSRCGATLILFNAHQVFGMFLDVLSRFIEEHKEYLDDFLFLMLLRLLHRQGTDMLSSVHYKLMAVLELIRKNFEPEQQFSTLGRILTDPQQPMNTKVKLAWLEYFLEVIAQMEPSDFKDDVGILSYPRIHVCLTHPNGNHGEQS